MGGALKSVTSVFDEIRPDPPGWAWFRGCLAGEQRLDLTGKSPLLRGSLIITAAITTCSPVKGAAPFNSLAQVGVHGSSAQALDDTKWSKQE